MGNIVKTLSSVEALEPLPPEEQTELNHIEVKFKAGWSTFMEIGRGLATVSAKKLFRAKYRTFEEYCLKELGFSRPYSYTLIGSSQVHDQMSAIEDIKVKPVNEAQCRELIYVPKEKRPEAWKKALAVAGNEPLTAKMIHEAVAPYKPWNKNKPKTKKRVQSKSVDLKPAIKLLEKVEEAAEKDKASLVLTELAALRKYLEGLLKV